MMRALAILLLLTLAPCAVADELILKDGKKIEWTDLHDAGDAYEVTTPQGAKITVKKVDVERLSTPAKVAVPLTGASFTFDKKKKLQKTDVLKTIDLKRDTMSGTWVFEKDILVGKFSDPDGKLQTTFALPEEYDIDAVIEHVDGRQDLFIGLVGGGKQFAISFDGGEGNGSGVTAGKPLAGETSIVGRLFPLGTPTPTRIMVREDAFILQINKKDMIAFKTDWKEATLPQRMAVRAKGNLFFGVYLSQWKIHSCVVTAPKDK